MNTRTYTDGKTKMDIPKMEFGYSMKNVEKVGSGSKTSFIRFLDACETKKNSIIQIYEYKMSIV